MACSTACMCLALRLPLATVCHCTCVQAACCSPAGGRPTNPWAASTAFQLESFNLSMIFVTENYYPHCISDAAMPAPPAVTLAAAHESAAPAADEEDRVSVSSSVLADKCLGSYYKEAGGSCLKPVLEDDKQAVSQAYPRLPVRVRSKQGPLQICTVCPESHQACVCPEDVRLHTQHDHSSMLDNLCCSHTKLGFPASFNACMGCCCNLVCAALCMPELLLPVVLHSIAMPTLRS